MWEQILNQMNVNDKFPIDKQVQVLNFDKFYLLETKNKQKIILLKNKQLFVLHLIVFDKYNKSEIDAENNRNYL
jgi:hypothetical protein